MGGAGRARIMGERKRAGCSVTSGTTRVRSSKTIGFGTTRVRSSSTTRFGPSRTTGLGTTGVLAPLLLLDLCLSVGINEGSWAWLDEGGGDETAPAGGLWRWWIIFPSLRSCKYLEKFQKSNDLTSSISQCGKDSFSPELKMSLTSPPWHPSLSTPVQNFWAKAQTSIPFWRSPSKPWSRICLKGSRILSLILLKSSVTNHLGKQWRSKCSLMSLKQRSKNKEKNKAKTQGNPVHRNTYQKARLQQPKSQTKQHIYRWQWT